MRICSKFDMELGTESNNITGMVYRTDPTYYNMAQHSVQV
jgi:hypothetical protein